VQQPEERLRYYASQFPLMSAAVRRALDGRVIADGDFIEGTVAEDLEVRGGVRHDGVLVVIEPAVRPLTLLGLPPGRMSLPIFNMVLKRITVRGSIVGTRQDLEEALTFARSAAVSAHFSWDKLQNINDIFARMADGRIDGRIVVKLQ
jgi:hypothetical protein